MKSYKPTTPSRRHMITIDYRKVLTASKPFKALTKGGQRHVGRNSAGRITVRHKGGGHKRVFRLVKFVLKKINIPRKNQNNENEPNRSGFISFVWYNDGERRYH